MYMRDQSQTAFIDFSLVLEAGTTHKFSLKHLAYYHAHLPQHTHFGHMFDLAACSSVNDRHDCVNF